MRMKAIYSLVCCLFFLMLFSCQNEQVNVSLPKKEAKEIPLKYASLFSIEETLAYKKITVKNPWNFSEIYATYVLLKKEVKLPTQLPENAIVVRIPVDNIVTLSATHIGLLDLLDIENKLIGHSQFDYLYNKKIRKRIKEGKMVEVGSAQNLNVEQLIDLSPNLIMTSGNEKISDNLHLVEKVGIPVAYNIEWMEKTPLGRAEWVKFMAAFFDKSELADSVFNTIEKKYLKVKNKLSGITNKPNVLVGNNYKDTWYAPGGNSYLAHLLRDVGANYYWFKDTTTGSLALSFEEVIDKQLNTDVWINPGTAFTISELLKQDNRYRKFNSLKNEKIYNFNHRVNEIGANDYWESGVVNPHLILSDLAKIFHPNLFLDDTLVYYNKLGQ